MNGSKKSIVQQKKELDRKTLFFYGLADMPIQMAAIPVAAFIPNYYGQDLGLRGKNVRDFGIEEKSGSGFG